MGGFGNKAFFCLKRLNLEGTKALFFVSLID